MCTEDFRMVTLRVTRGGQPQPLDRWETLRSATGTALRRADSSAIQPGLYAVATDAERAQISSCGERFVFRGWVGKKKVVEARFLLKDDCCHVQRVEGPEELVVN